MDAGWCMQVTHVKPNPAGKRLWTWSMPTGLQILCRATEQKSNSEESRDT